MVALLARHIQRAVFDPHVEPVFVRQLLRHRAPLPALILDWPDGGDGLVDPRRELGVVGKNGEHHFYFHAVEIERDVARDIRTVFAECVGVGAGQQKRGGDEDCFYGAHDFSVFRIKGTMIECFPKPNGEAMQFIEPIGLTEQAA